MNQHSSVRHSSNFRGLHKWYDASRKKGKEWHIEFREVSKNRTNSETQQGKQYGGEQEVASSRKQTCWECQEPGHVAYRCPKKTSKTSVGNNSWPVIWLIIPTNTSNAIFHKDVKLNGYLVKAYVDIRSQVITIRRSDANSSSLPYKEESTVTLQCTNCRLRFLSAISRWSESRDEVQADVLLVSQTLTEQPGTEVIKNENSLTFFWCSDGSI